MILYILRLLYIFIWACKNELSISTEILSVVIDIVDLFIQIFGAGVNMSVLNVVVVIGYMEANQSTEVVIVI